MDLLAKSMDLPLPQVLSLAYKKDGRETLKGIYESMNGNQGKFDELMNNLEQIYSIDNLLIHGYGEQLQSQTPLNITMQDGITKFQGNLNTYRELMNKTERELVATYMENYDTEYILQNYDEVAQFLTTPDLRDNFLTAVHELRDLSQDNRSSNNTINFEDYRTNIEQTTETPQFEMPEGYSINEFGKIIRPAREEKQEQVQESIDVQPNETKLSLKQRVAQFLQKNNLFMNLSFVDKFVHKQLDVLPSPTQEIRETNTSTTYRTRESFINELTNFGAYRNLPPIQRMSDPERMAQMRRKMEQNQQSNDDNERG